MSWYTGNISYGTLLDLIPPPSLEAPAAAPFLFLPPYPVPAVIELGSGEVLVGLWSQLSQHLAPPPMCYTESMGAKRSSLSAQRLSELENGILVKLRY